MHRICVAIWETGEWQEEWTFSTFIPLPKKGDLKQCANYRTIALVSRASKILLRIILERIQVKTRTEIAEEQGDSDKKGDKRPNHESQNIDVQKKARKMCFVDFKKAFDSISDDKLWLTMMDMGYPRHLIDLLAKLYRKQLAKIKVPGTVSKWFRVKKGVRQGCDFLHTGTCSTS